MRDYKRDPWNRKSIWNSPRFIVLIVIAVMALVGFVVQITAGKPDAVWKCPDGYFFVGQHLTRDVTNTNMCIPGVPAERRVVREHNE